MFKGEVDKYNTVSLETNKRNIKEQFGIECNEILLLFETVIYFYESWYQTHIEP